MSKNKKSILKNETKCDFFHEPKAKSRAEELFDEFFGVTNSGVTNTKVMNTYNRRPLKTIQPNLAPNQRPFDSSESEEDENQITCIHVDEVEPRPKSGRRDGRHRDGHHVDEDDDDDQKKRTNRVRFNVRESEKTSTKQRKIPRKKTNTNYPDCTKDSLLRAFENANLPDFDLISKHELHVSRYVPGQKEREDPPTPPAHKIWEPFEDLVDWKKVDLNRSDPFDSVFDGKRSKFVAKKPSDDDSSEWQTTDTSRDEFNDEENTMIESSSAKSGINVPDARNDTRNDFSGRFKIPKDGKQEKLHSAGLGFSRVASTPVTRRGRHDVILQNNAVSPIQLNESIIENDAATHFNNRTRDEDGFRVPLNVATRKSKRTTKVSTPISCIRLDVVDPSRADLDKVSTRKSTEPSLRSSIKSSTRSKSLLSESSKRVSFAESEKEKHLDHSLSDKNLSNTLIESNDKTLTERNAEYSSIFAPKVKSTPLLHSMGSHQSFLHSSSAFSSHFDLFVDRSHLDASMSRLFLPSQALLNAKRKSVAPKTTSIEPVFDDENHMKRFSRRKEKSLIMNKETFYQVYRKSLAAAHSRRSVVRTSVVVKDPSREHFESSIHLPHFNVNDVKKYDDFSLTLAFSSSKVVYNNGEEEVLTAKEKVLMVCEPHEIIAFDQVFDDWVLKHCKKIGEGSYGEVYSSKDIDGEEIVIKIIALMSHEEDTFAQIFPELIISLTFNCLQNNEINRTPNFIHLKRATCAKGVFPSKLIHEWDLFAKNKLSENEDPRKYDCNQLYLVLLLSNGGTDLESYKLKNAVEALSVFSQIAFSLAAAENQLQFEHRDLHWGNVLVASTSETHLKYCINGRFYQIESQGVFASIIDFSLSRMQKEGFIIYDDLSKYEDLFQGVGEYQFDVYRLMREHNGNDWQKFSPYTNILWLHYMLEKLLNVKRYRARSNKHQQSLMILKQFFSVIKEYGAATEFVESQIMLKQDFVTQM